MIIHILQVREQSLQGVGQLALNQPGLPMLYRYINLPNLSSLKEQEFIFHSRGRQVSGVSAYPGHLDSQATPKLAHSSSVVIVGGRE